MAPITAIVDELDDVLREVARLMKEAEFFSLLVPLEYGSIDMKSVHNCITHEELSRICLRADLLFAEMALCTFPPSSFGTPVLKQKYLPNFVREKNLGSFVLTELDASSDATNMKMTARWVVITTFLTETSVSLLSGYSHKYMSLSHAPTLIQQDQAVSLP